jgi:hypothetical protein
MSEFGAAIVPPFGADIPMRAAAGNATSLLR